MNSSAAGGESSKDQPRVAILGCGRMGSAIARRLDKQGCDLHLWNRTKSRAEAVGVGAVADTPADAARASDVTLSSLTGPDAVRAAYEGDQGALSVAEGRLFVEMSTAGPDVQIELAPQVKARGGRFVEAPVLGGPLAAEHGMLVILAGGESADIDRARPVLEALGEVRHVGMVGQGTRLKLIANTMLAIVSAAAAELQAAGVNAGLSPEDAFYVLQRLVPYLEFRKAGYLEGRYEPVTFALKDILKDIRLGLDVYQRIGSETPLAEATERLYAGIVSEHGDQEMSAINARFRPE